MMKKEDFQDIVNRYVNGKASEQEQRLLEEYYNRMTEQAPSLPAEDEERLRLDMLTAILERSGISEAPVVTLKPAENRSGGWYRYASAAAILIGISFGTYFLIQNKKETQPPLAVVPAKTDVTPGGNKAILTLGNGSKIILDSVANGSLALQGNTNVIKIDSGKLTYNASTEKPNQAEVVFNTLSTPRGGEYQLILPDRTKVWLNASSSITYPTAFTGGQRKVMVTGEVYFEVEHDATKPFSVSVKGIEVQDIGTHFDIKAYSDEEQIRTTLLEGKVRIVKSNQFKILVPGEQARISSNGDSDQILVKIVNTEDVVAWKNGFFHFDQVNIQTVMRELSRWYDIDVQFEKPISNHLYAGDIGRALNLSQVLELLKTTNVHFKMDGRTLIVQ